MSDRRAVIGILGNQVLVGEPGCSERLDLYVDDTGHLLALSPAQAAQHAALQAQPPAQAAAPAMGSAGSQGSQGWDASRGRRLPPSGRASDSAGPSPGQQLELDYQQGSI